MTLNERLRIFDQQLADAVKSLRAALDLVHRTRMTVIRIHQHVQEAVTAPKPARTVRVVGGHNRKPFTIELTRLSELLAKEAMVDSGRTDNQAGRYTDRPGLPPVPKGLRQVGSRWVAGKGWRPVYFSETGRKMKKVHTSARKRRERNKTT